MSELETVLSGHPFSRRLLAKLAMPSLDHDGTTRDIPSYYQPNALLCGIRLDGCDLPLTVQVIFPFTPFCMSQVLLVKPIGDLNALKLPPKFILKVYDPRFYPYRLRTANKPWSYAAETEAAEKRPARRNPEFDECNTPKTDDAVSWEEFFYQFSEEQFYYESSAYIRLASLQGKVIPRYFGAGELRLEGRAISPHVIILEYIPDAQRLDAVDPNSVTLSTAQSLIDAAQKIDALGVSHRDYNPGNILFSHGKGMIIDFGGCNVREIDSDEEWAAVVRLDGNVWNMKKWMRNLLKKSGLKNAFIYFEAKKLTKSL